MNAKELTIAGLQKHMADRYAQVDRARGTPKTFLWFMEEVGELATALNDGKDRDNLERNSRTYSRGCARWRPSTMSIWLKRCGRNTWGITRRKGISDLRFEI